MPPRTIARTRQIGRNDFPSFIISSPPPRRTPANDNEQQERVRRQSLMPRERYGVAHWLDAVFLCNLVAVVGLVGSFFMLSELGPPLARRGFRPVQKRGVAFFSVLETRERFSADGRRPWRPGGKPGGEGRGEWRNNKRPTLAAPGPHRHGRPKECVQIILGARSYDCASENPVGRWCKPAITDTTDPQQPGVCVCVCVLGWSGRRGGCGAVAKPGKRGARSRRSNSRAPEAGDVCVLASSK
ncbi:hypothetical protein GQ53DRAFT_30034 [Thozetella sp. PMI_491]|nr:hypothetical protein GQ53DRAFT_30034 [Thozetella sp. PMI_491]